MTPRRIGALLLGSSAVAGVALAVRALLRRPLDRTRRELAELEGRIDEQRRHMADAVHALRAPLTVMRTELDVGLRDPELAPAAREVLVSAREEIDKVSRMGGDIHLTAWSDGPRVGVTVSDSGPGVRTDARAHVFERFYRDTGAG